MSRLRRLLATDAAYTLVVARAARAVVSLASAPLIARSIGAEGRGETAAAFAAFYIVPIVIALGVPLEVRRSSSAGDPGPVLRTVRGLTLLAVVPSTLVAGGLYVSLFSGLDVGARIVAFASIALAPIMIDWMCSENALLALGRYRVVATMQIAHPLTLLTIVLFLAVTGTASVSTVIGANVIACLPSMLIGRIRLHRYEAGASRAPALGVLRRSLPYAGASAAEAATNRFDQMLVLPLIGAYEAGLYSVAVTVGVLPLAFGQALGAVVFRDMARAPAHAQGDIAVDGARRGVALGLIVSALLAIATPVAVPLIFGASFVAAVGVTLIVLVGSVFCAAGYVCSMLLAAQSSGKRMTAAQLLSLAATIGLLCVLGPVAGAVGAAVASTIGYLVLLVSTICLLRLSLLSALPRVHDFRQSIVAITGSVSRGP